MTRLLVFVPTYNERENVETLNAQLQALPMAFDLLFLDDDSPDGTGEALDNLASRHANITVLHRRGTRGIGSAHREALHWASARGYELLITMDADGTHPPRYIPDLLKRAETAQVVIGSRYLTKESFRDWTPFRKLLTKTAHLLTWALLGMRHDVASAYRLYRLTDIPATLFDDVKADGYAFFFESVHILSRRGFTIEELAIVVPIRTKGRSKLTPAETLRSLARLVRVAMAVRLRR